MKDILLKPVRAFISRLRENERKRNRLRLTNKSPSIISSNCVGGIICHDLKIPFNSPTVGLCFSDADFIRFVTHLREYLESDLTEVKDSGKEFPVGRLSNDHGEVDILFMHAADFAEAKEKWVRRSGRVDFDNLFVVWESPSGCSAELMEQFRELEFRNKVILTDEKGEFSLPLGIYGDGYRSGKILFYENRMSTRRYLDRFDYVRFLNSGDIALR